MGISVEWTFLFGDACGGFLFKDSDECFFEPNFGRGGFFLLVKLYLKFYDASMFEDLFLLFRLFAIELYYFTRSAYDKYYDRYISWLSWKSVVILSGYGGLLWSKFYSSELYEDLLCLSIIFFCFKK